MPRGVQKPEPSAPGRHPALALLEYASVAVGIQAADALVKRAPIALLKTGTVHPGHYLVMIGGTVAAVEEAYAEGLAVGAAGLLDSVLLPDVHAQVHDAALGSRQELTSEALGVLETQGTAALLRGADAGVKGAAVSIAEIRLADDLGGRAFVLFDGAVADVTAALEIAAERLNPGQIVHCSLMPRLDGDLRRLLNAGTRFTPCAPATPEGAEQHEELSDAAR